MPNLEMSEFDTATTTIEGKEYVINMLNTSDAFIMGQDLIKLTLPSLGAAADGMFTQVSLEEPSTFTAIAFHLIRQLGDINTLEMIKKLLKGVKVDNNPIDFEKHFRGKLDLLALLIEFAIKENFGSLFMGTSLRKRLMDCINDLNSGTQGLRKSVESVSSLTENQE
jgi:hypothetical protein